MRNALKQAEAWARTLKRPSKCLTCRAGEPVVSVVKHLRLNMKVATESIWDYVREHHGYEGSLGAMYEHVRHLQREAADEAKRRAK
jgi:hypothetical protein